MRIRQIRPEFWTDETMAAMSPAVRLFYIGLWNIADDLGFLEWRIPRIGAVLFPYEHPKRRERDVATWAERLIESGRLRIFDCGCAEIPTLAKHQRVTGRQSFTVQEKHSKHRTLTAKHGSAVDSPVTERNVTERNGMSPDDLFADRDADDLASLDRARAIRKLRGASA